MEEAIAHAERLGHVNQTKFSRNVQVWFLFRMGSWDEALPPTEEFIAACEAGERHYHEGGMRIRRAAVRLARDDVDGALEDVAKVIPLAHSVRDPQARVPWFSECACLLVHAGKPEEAQPLAREVLQVEPFPFGMGDLALVARELGRADELLEHLEHGPQTRWTDAANSLLRGDFAGAADILEEMGDAELEAFARLRAAEELAAEGRRAEADEQLQRSLVFWRSVRATRFIRQAEALLAAAS